MDKDNTGRQPGLFTGSTAKRTFNNIFFPEICSSCGEVNEGFLCEKCRQEISEIKNTSCSFCGAPAVSGKQAHARLLSSNENLLPGLLHGDTGNGKEAGSSEKPEGTKKRVGCPACRDNNYSFHMLRSFGLYESVLKKLIVKFKYSKVYTLAPILSSFLEKTYLENYRDENIDYMDCVPDYHAFKNGLDDHYVHSFGHMNVLAEIFAQKTGIPFAGNLAKIKKTSKQHALGVYERKVNLEGSFKVPDSLKTAGKNILLIDDVWTTGNTLNEISRVLKKCGAQKIYLLTIARAI
jgi:ComF family protein